MDEMTDERAQRCPRCGSDDRTIHKRLRIEPMSELDPLDDCECFDDWHTAPTEPDERAQRLPVKNRNVPGGKEFWDHVENVAKNMQPAMPGEPTDERAQREAFERWVRKYGLNPYDRGGINQIAEDAYSAGLAARELSIDQKFSEDRVRQQEMEQLVSDAVGTCALQQPHTGDRPASTVLVEQRLNERAALKEDSR